MGNYGATFVRRTDRLKCGSIKNNYAIIKCRCGKEYETLISDVVANKSKSCGCGKIGSNIKAHEPGEIINGVKFIRSLGTYRRAQFGIFECPICGKHWRSSVCNIQHGNTKSCCNAHVGYRKSYFVNRGAPISLYQTILYNDHEAFIKIGITTQRINARLRGIPYKKSILRVITGDPSVIFDLEYRYKKIYEKYKYIPKFKFKGSGECFTYKAVSL